MTAWAKNKKKKRKVDHQVSRTAGRDHCPEQLKNPRCVNTAGITATRDSGLTSSRQTNSPEAPEPTVQAHKRVLSDATGRCSRCFYGIPLLHTVYFAKRHSPLQSFASPRRSEKSISLFPASPSFPLFFLPLLFHSEKLQSLLRPSFPLFPRLSFPIFPFFLRFPSFFFPSSRHLSHLRSSLPFSFDCVPSDVYLALDLVSSSLTSPADSSFDD